jgi:hypothetical protein
VNHVAFGTINNSALDQTIVNRVANLFRDGLKGGLDNGWSFGPVHVIEGNSPGKVWDDSTVEVGTAGAAVYSPPAVSLVVSKQTGLVGKTHRGRIYFPGVPETLVDEAGVIDAAYLASMQTLFDNLLTSINGDAAVNVMVLLHDSASPGDHAATEIVKLLVRGVCGTMRPRQRR